MYGPIDTRRRFNVYKTSIRRRNDVVCLRESRLRLELVLPMLKIILSEFKRIS